MSDAPSYTVLDIDGIHILQGVISLAMQTLFYGMHLILVSFGVHILLKRESTARPNMYILLAILFPFLLSSLYWALQLAELLIQTWVFFVEPAEQDSLNLTYYTYLFDDIILINYLVSDGVVLWRAWVLCKDDYSRLLFAPALSFVLTTLTYALTVGVRIASYFTAAGPGSGNTDSYIIDVFHVSFPIWSFLTNLTATSIVGLKAWQHRQVLRMGLRNAPNRRTRGEQILTLLIESGFLYCLGGPFALGAVVIKIPWGTVGDITNPTSLQLAGMYPTIVIVLISMKPSMDYTQQRQTSPTGSLFAEGTPKDPNVSVQIQFARSALSYGGTASQESLDPGSRAEAIEARRE